MLNKAVRELEFKVELDIDSIDIASRHPALTRLATKPARTERLQAIYFDTRTRRLEAAGISLRVRDEGGEWIQTVKLGRGVSLGLSSPTEVSMPVARPRPQLDLITDSEVRDQVIRAIGTHELRRMFETVVMRSTHLIWLPRTSDRAAESLFEIAIDLGQVSTAVGDVMIREIEIELKDGPPAALLDAAELLLADLPFQIATENKAERGFRCLDKLPPKRLIDTVDPAGFPEDLTPDTLALDALREIAVAYCGSALAYKEQIPGDSDPEGPHQLRVNLRRLRTLLKAFRPVIDTPSLRRLSDKSRDLARIVGQLRDADVVATEIVPEPSAAPAHMDAQGLTALRERLTSAQTKVRSDVVAALNSPEHSSLMVEFALFPFVLEKAAGEPTEPPKKQPTFAQVGRKALSRSWKAVSAYGKDISGLSIDERHELRKELKGLRYTIEIFRPAFPAEAVADFVRQLRKMQDVFGYLNDVATAENHLEPLNHPELSDAHEAAAARDVIAWHATRSEDAWRNARKRWRRLCETPRFWVRQKDERQEASTADTPVLEQA